MSHLRSLCKHYRNQDVIISHVNPVLDSFNGLHPEQNDFVYDDGRVELLLCITGTIEVIYRGTAYHCPIAIWLPLEYPNRPPMVRILPSSTMQIRVGRVVDPNGQVIVTYLADWERKGEGRSLMPLMEELRAQFGIEYPLQLISTSTRQQVPPRPPPLQSSSSGPSRSPSMSSGIPPRPPPPPQQYYDPNSRRISQGDSLEYGNSQGIPPRPSYPPSTTGSPEQTRYGSPLPSYQSQLASSQPRPSYSSPPPRIPNLPPRQSPPIQSSNLPPRPPLPPFRSGTVDPNQLPARPLSYQQTPPSFPNQALQPPPIPFQPSPSPGPPHFQPSRAGSLPNYSTSHLAPVPLQVRHSIQRAPSLVNPPASWQQPPQPPPLLPQQQQQHQQQYPQQYPSQPAQQSYTPQNSNLVSNNRNLHPISALTSQPQENRRLAVNILDAPEDMLSDISPTTQGNFSGGMSNGNYPQSQYPSTNSQPSTSNLQTSTSTPPPRPPNPELLAIRSRLHSKLTLALSNLSATTHSSIQQQDLITEDLRKGVPAIQDEMSRLEAVKAVCENVRSRYATVVAEGEGRLRVYEERGEGPEVDEIVCSSTVVYNQLLELVADDAALEDTIYHLGRGLNSETANIDLDQFLKRVRGLAREQFAKRALINKILLSLAVRRDRV